MGFGPAGCGWGSGCGGAGSGGGMGRGSGVKSGSGMGLPPYDRLNIQRDDFDEKQSGGYLEPNVHVVEPGPVPTVALVHEEGEAPVGVPSGSYGVDLPRSRSGWGRRPKDRNHHPAAVPVPHNLAIRP